MTSTLNANLSYEWARLQHGRTGAEEIRGLILDMRGNGGGFVKEAQSFLENFLPGQSVVSYVQRVADRDEAPVIPGEKSLLQVPLRTDGELRLGFPENILVLVDRGTASAAEMVVGALSAHQNVIVAGESSFGKGIGQNPFDVADPFGGIVAITDMFLFSPDGKSFQGGGVPIDVPFSPGDPVNEWQRLQSGLPFRMGELRDQDASHERLLATPSDIIPTIPMEEIEKPLSRFAPDLAAAAAKMEKPPSCHKTPAASDFREEDDCLLDWATLLMKKLIELKS